MIQKTLDGYNAAYTCKCGKTFDTMSNIKKHHAKSHKIKREKLNINFVLENFKMISIKTSEISDNTNFDYFSMVLESNYGTKTELLHEI